MNFKKRTKGVLVSAGITMAMVIGLGAGVAHADPVPAGNRTIALVGSETTTPVMDALANDAGALALGGVRQVASFNATGSATIDTHGGTVAACTAVPRPNGSSAGRAALLSSLTAANGCIQGARSSSNHLSGGTPISTDPNLTFIPFARESISFAITNTSNFSKNLTNTQLVAYFNCTAPTTLFSYKSMLPQNGSGTRSYWIGEMYPGQTIPNSGPISGKTCVQNGADEGGAVIEEHDGRQVNNTEIVPMSVAQWSSQTSGVITDVRGATRVGQIGSTNPFADDFAKQRDLYNVFAQSDVDAVSPAAGSVADTIQKLFVGPTAQICTNTTALAIIQRFGLRPPQQSCGNTSNDTT